MVLNCLSKLPAEISLVLSHIIYYSFYNTASKPLAFERLNYTSCEYRWWHFYVKHMLGNIFILPNQLRYPVSSHLEAPHSRFIPLLVTQALLNHFTMLVSSFFCERNSPNLTLFIRETNYTNSQLTRILGKWMISLVWYILLSGEVGKLWNKFQISHGKLSRARLRVFLAYSHVCVMTAPTLHTEHRFVIKSDMWNIF